MQAIWRIDCQHAEFDGAFTEFRFTQNEAMARVRMLAPWGWFCDAESINVPNRVNTRELIDKPWPVVSMKEIEHLLAWGKEPIQPLERFDIAEKP